MCFLICSLFYECTKRFALNTTKVGTLGVPLQPNETLCVTLFEETAFFFNTIKDFSFQGYINGEKLETVKNPIGITTNRTIQTEVIITNVAKNESVFEGGFVAITDMEGTVWVTNQNVTKEIPTKCSPILVSGRPKINNPFAYLGLVKEDSPLTLDVTIDDISDYVVIVGNSTNELHTFALKGKYQYTGNDNVYVNFYKPNPGAVDKGVKSSIKVHNNYVAENPFQGEFKNTNKIRFISSEELDPCDEVKEAGIGAKVIVIIVSICVVILGFFIAKAGCEYGKNKMENVQVNKDLIVEDEDDEKVETEQKP